MREGFPAGIFRRRQSLYGMARLLLDADKKPERMLKKGEHKAISNARVTFTPANDKTTETVKEIFYLFTVEEKALKEVAIALNAKGIPSANGGQWNHQKVLHVLTNDTYIGTKTYNKKWHRLKQRHRKNPRNGSSYRTPIPLSLRRIIPADTRTSFRARSGATKVQITLAPNRP